MNTKIKLFDCYDGVCFFNGLVFFAPVALLVRTQAGVSEYTFFLLQALLSGVIFLGEIPTGLITDKIGYRNSLILAQVLLFCARGLLLLAFLKHSLVLFILEAIVEGVATCFTSGTGSAYLYDYYGDELYMQKSAHANNFGTAGFIISTVSYVVIYKLLGIEGLLAATVIADILSMIMTFFLPKELKAASEVNDNLNLQNKKYKKTEKNIKESRKYTEEENINANDKELEKYRVRNASLFADINNMFKHKQAFIYVAMLSVFGIAWILITFFYVERLESCGISAEWMSLIVLIYSALQMLSEPLIHRFRKVSKSKMLLLGATLAGILLIVFGLVKVRWLILILMLVLPLTLNLPEYYVMEQENQFVDKIGSAKNRATALSGLNMGVNVIEIVALFASAILSSIDIEWCFLFIGVAVIACAAVLYRSRE